MGKARLERIKQKYWSNTQPVKPQKEFVFNFYCEQCEKLYGEKNILRVMALPSDKELYKLIESMCKFVPPLNVFKRTFILFGCQKCNWQKFTKLDALIYHKIINPDICKNCTLDICLFVDCTIGGFIYDKTKI